MQPVTIKIPKQLPSLLIKDKRLRKAIGTLLQLKAIYPGSRFKRDIKSLQDNAELCGMKTFKTLNARLKILLQLKLCKKQDDCIYLATWDELLSHFGLIKKRFYEYVMTERPVDLVLKEYWMMEEKQRFEEARDYKLNKDLDLQNSIRSVCGDSFKKSEISRSQLEMFCKSKEGTDEEAEFFLLYARTAAGRFYYKADAHISVQHYSQAAGYKNKNGFCYSKKQMIEWGMIESHRREHVIDKGLRKTLQRRQTNVGTYFFDHSTNQQKLRQTDKIVFLNPGLPVPEKMQGKTKKNAS